MNGRLYDDIAEWCDGKSWIWRAILLTFLAWMGLGYLRDPLAWGMFSGINLGIHELGHMIFMPLGEFMYVFGGTLTQIAVPVIAGYLLYSSQRDYFGVSVAGVWLSMAIFEAAAYVGDARSQALNLVSPGGGEPQHDWTYLLSAMGLLEQDVQIMMVLRGIAGTVLVLSVIFGALLCLRMSAARKDSGCSTTTVR